MTAARDLTATADALPEGEAKRHAPPKNVCDVHRNRSGFHLTELAEGMYLQVPKRAAPSRMLRQADRQCLTDVEDAQATNNYDRMCSAIVECHCIDEVAEYKNQARALEVYARQAKNTDAERRCCEIRLRAERRTGELLKELARATPAEAGAVSNGGKGRMSNDATSGSSPYAETLERTGISRQTAHRYQALADVPQETFDAALREPEKPTTSGVLAKHEAMRTVLAARDPTPQMPSDSLWLWGRMRDLERDGYFDKDAAALLFPMTETMRADMVRVLPLAVDFFRSLNEAAASVTSSAPRMLEGAAP